MGSGGRSRPAAGNITPTLSPLPAPGPVPPTARSRATSGRSRSRDGAGGLGGSPPPPDWAGAAASTPELDDILAAAAAESALAAAARDLERDRWPSEPEVSYVDDPAAFQEAYQQALERRDRGEEPVPYMLEDATAGLGVRGAGRPFGVEIEFDIGPEVADRYEALAAIGRDLHAAGLTSTPRQQSYHSNRGAVSYEHDRGWRFETDSTVNGEIVSPVMYDEPETWRNLQRVCEIVRRHGGRATTRTGGHVHVGLEDYDHTVENHNRLLSTVNGYTDTLYRMAQNPAARRHRGTTWCAPNTVPASGYTSISTVRARNNSHSYGLNFQSVNGTTRDHVEFRMWDGSLNPGVIQAQVNLSLGITAAASRGGYTPPPRERIGTHQAANPRPRRLRGQEWRDSTRSFRQLADTVYRRAANSAQAAALFAVTRWQQ